MKINIILTTALTFILFGIIIVFYCNVQPKYFNQVMTLSNQTDQVYYFGEYTNINTPFDYLKDSQIHPHRDMLIINMNRNYFITGISNKSYSMKGILDYNSSAIWLNNVTDEDLHIGDIVIFKYNSTVIASHRITNIVIYDNVTYYSTKGDNNFGFDPNSITIKDRYGKLIGVLY